MTEVTQHTHRWIWRIRQNFITQFIQLLKLCLCDVWLSVVEKNWALSFDQCRLQSLQFSVHLMDLLSILLRYNSFNGTQKTEVDQMSSRPPVTMTFFGASLALGSALELLLSPATEMVIPGCPIKPTFHHTSQSDQETVHGSYTESEKTTLQKGWIFDLQSAHEAPT